MRFKGTALLLVVALSVGAYVYFYEIRGSQSRDKKKQEQNRVWKLDSATIQEISLTTASGGNQRVTAVRAGEKEWKLTAPRALEADSEEFGRVASSAADLSRESVVEGNAADMTVFGLASPQAKLELKTKDGRDYKIRFGNNNPSGSSTYAALEGKNEVFLVANYVASTFNKKLDDLRNRSVLNFDQFEVRSIDLKSEKGSVQLVKDNERWWLAGKERWAADSSGVNGVLGALSNTKLKEFFDEDPEQYATLGLDKPTVEADLTVGKDKAIKRLVVGLPKSKLLKKGEKPKPEPKKEKAKDKDPKKDSKKEDKDKKEETASPPELYIARDDSRKELFFVEKEFVDKLLKSPSDLRDKALAAFQRWDIDDITLKNSKGEFHFSKPSGSGDWVLGDAKKKTKWDAVSGILDALEKPVKSFVDQPAQPGGYGLDAPKAQVTLRQGGAVKVEVGFGKETAEGVYASVRGESSVKVADKESLQKLDKGEADFVEPPAPAAVNPHTSEPPKKK